MKINAGIIQWFNSEKRFGVITNEQNEDYFIHKSHITESIDSIKPGDFFIFEPGFENNKNAALSLRKLKEKVEFEYAIIEFFNKSNFELQIEVKKETSYGGQKVVKEIRGFNFFGLAAYSFFRDIKYEEQFALFDYFFDLILRIHGSRDTFEYFNLTFEKYKRFNLTNDNSVNSLFSSYLSRLDDYGTFKVWQGYNKLMDFQKTDPFIRFGLSKEEMPFPLIKIDYDLIIKHSDELNKYDYLEIRDYDNSDELKEILIDKKTQANITDKEYLQTIAEMGHYLGSQNICKLKILNKIDQELNFELWKTGHTWKRDYEIISFCSIDELEQNILTNTFANNYMNLSYWNLYKISNKNKNKEDIVFNVLLAKLNNTLQTSDFQTDFLESIKLLKVEKQEVVLNKFLSEIKQINWSKLIYKKLISLVRIPFVKFSLFQTFS